MTNWTKDRIDAFQAKLIAGIGTYGVGLVMTAPLSVATEIGRSQELRFPVSLVLAMMPWVVGILQVIFIIGFIWLGVKLYALIAWKRRNPGWDKEQ